jgi:flagellar basal-body rod protein FlgB
MLNRLTSSLDFQGQALSLRAERQRLIASNIANADTPNYVARDMNFAQVLREATGSAVGAGAGAGAGIGAVPMTGTSATRAGHIGLDMQNSMRSESRLNYASPSQTNLDRNTVDMDRERANFADNSVKFEATLRFINGSAKTMLDAIRGQ